MDGLGKHIGGSTQILLGIGVDRELGTRLRVSVLSSIGSKSEQPAEVPFPAAAHVEPEEEPTVTEDSTPDAESAPEEDSVPLDERPQEESQEPPPVEIYDEPSPEPEPETAAPDSTPPPTGKKPVKQEAFEFEPVTRGRFAKSEPNIVDGEDLDIPTFMRKKPKV